MNQKASFSVSQAKRIGVVVNEFEANGRNKLGQRRDYPMPTDNGTNSSPITTETVNNVTGVAVIGNNLTVSKQIQTIILGGATSSQTFSLGGPGAGGLGGGGVTVVNDSTIASSTGDTIIFNGSWQNFSNSTFSIAASQLHAGTVVEIHAAGLYVPNGGFNNQYIRLNMNGGTDGTMFWALQGTGGTHQEWITTMLLTCATATSGSMWGHVMVNNGPPLGFDPGLSANAFADVNENIATGTGFTVNGGTWSIDLIGDSGTGTVTLTSLVVKLAT